MKTDFCKAMQLPYCIGKFKLETAHLFYYKKTGKKGVGSAFPHGALGMVHGMYSYRNKIQNRSQCW